MAVLRLSHRTSAEQYMGVTERQWVRGQFHISYWDQQLSNVDWCRPSTQPELSLMTRNIIMRPLLIVFLIGICTVPALAQQQPGKPPFTIVLVTPRPTVTLGSEVWITIRRTNTSDKDVNASAYIDKSTNLDLNYVLELRNSGGRPLPQVADKSPVGRFLDAQFGTLKPGETISNDINLLRLFDLKQPGKYTLQVSRRVPEALGGGVVKSNIITITITDKNDHMPPKH